MTNKFIKFIKENRIGLGAGAFVGLSVAAIYKFSGGDFMFAIADSQSRSAGFLSTLTNSEQFSLVAFATILGWVLIGALIGFFLDKKFGFKFSQKTKIWMLIIAGILLMYTLFGNQIINGDITGSREAGGTSIWGGITKIFSGKGGAGWFATLIFLAVSSITGLFQAIFAPQPTIPIWIFFVAGFAILLFLRKGGRQEQPLIIER